MTDMTIEQLLNYQDQYDGWRKFQLPYPPASIGRFSIERFTIPRDDETRIKIIMKEGVDRDPGHGRFCRLVETVPGGGKEGEDLRRIWMSDTRAEILEHMPFLEHVKSQGFFRPGRPLRILVNGLGLGLAIRGALMYNVGHIDVVESNDDIANLVGQMMPEDRVTIHSGDAYSIKWPQKTRWDLAWHDIWPEISDENIPGMNRLMGRYRNRVQWQGCWQRSGCLKMARIMKRAKKGKLSPEDGMMILAGVMHL